MNKAGLIAVAVAAVALAGCNTPTRFGTGYDLNNLKSASPQGSFFLQNLKNEYQVFSNSEATTQWDYQDSEFFAEKGLKVAKGQDVLPEMPSEWNIPKSAEQELEKARAEFMAVRAKGAEDKPIATAKAQVFYDCWIEQTQENWQTGDIALCKEGFKKYMAELTKVKVAKPKPAAVAPQQFVIYFDFDKSTVNPVGQTVVNAIIEAAKGMAGKKLNLVGHTDTSGSAAYNQRLSVARSAAVKNALVKGSIPAANVMTSGVGESQPAVGSGDGVKEQQNRRVVVTFQ